jgi:hypothetical protein
MSTRYCGCDLEGQHICKDHRHYYFSILLRFEAGRPRVVIESPLGAPTREGIEENKMYARMCMRDSLIKGEAPYASHLLYDHREILDDLKPDERELGLSAGLDWGNVAQITAVYVDRGISKGMIRGIASALTSGRKIDYRTLEPGKIADVDDNFKVVIR